MTRQTTGQTVDLAMQMKKRSNGCQQRSRQKTNQECFNC